MDSPPLYETGAIACVGCGYSLRGLVSPGRCPECGRPYQDACVRVWGVAPGPLMKRTDVEPLSPTIRIAYNVLLVAMPLYMLGVAIHIGDRSMEFAVIPLTAFFAWQIRVRNRAPEFSQVWLAAEGYGTRPGEGRMRVRRWRQEEIDFTKRRENQYWFVIRKGLATPAALYIVMNDTQAADLRDRIQFLIGRHVGLER